jgi:AAA15 family ATPase/GTPase
MISKFGVKNFVSFKDGIEVNFEFDGKVPESVKLGRDISPVLGVKGANGSGKTNIIKAIEFISKFCSRSAELDVDEEIPIDTFFQSEEPSQFYIEFEADGRKYFYELELVREKVIREEIYRKKDRKVPVLKRSYNKISYSIRELSELKKIKIKSNSSIISLFRKYDFKSEMTDLTILNDFFYDIITNVTSLGYVDIDLSYKEISEMYAQDERLFGFVKNVLMQSDSGIKDIFIEKRKDNEGKDVYFPIFLHAHESKSFFLTIHDESSGTKALFVKMAMYWTVLMSGGVLALDEFDIHLHAMVLPLIVNLFISKDVNKFDAQLIFTAHNTEIIDCLGKYRTILVNKEDCESYCYRLDEISGSMIRNDRPISPIYLDGKIGGTPLNLTWEDVGEVVDEV